MSDTGFSTDDLFAGSRSPASDEGVHTEDLFKSPAAVAAPAIDGGVHTDDLFKEEKPYQAPAIVDDVVNAVGSAKDKIASYFSSDPAEEAARTSKLVTDSPATMAVDALKTAKSGVGWTMEKLMVPENIVAGAVVKGLEAGGVDGIQKSLNPEGKLIPDLAYHDIINYMGDRYIGKPEELKQKLMDAGYGPDLTAAATVAYLTARTGVGMAANVMGDPLMMLSLGTLTEAGKSAMKAGDFANVTRNAVELRRPDWGMLGAGLMNGQTIAALPAAKVDEALGAARSAIEAVPGGSKATAAYDATKSVVNNTAGRLLRALDYSTGDPELDLIISTHAARSRGAGHIMFEKYVQPYQDLNFTQGERDLAIRLVENTPNQLPNLDPKVLAAMGQAGGKSADEIRASMQAILPKLAQGIEELDHASMVPGRAESIVETAMRAKELGAGYLEKRAAAGKLTEQNAASSILQNYFAHVADPALMRQRNPEMAAALAEVKLQQQVKNATRGTSLSRFDSGKFERTIEGTLEEANKIMKERAGVSDFFVRDPIAPMVMKNLEADRLMRDKEVLDYIEARGMARTFKSDSQAAANGYGPIRHAELGEKVMELPDGTKQMVNALYFPREIADKLSYYLNKREVGNFAAYWDAYNRIFRTTALLSPGYYARNIADNVLKNFVQGVKLEDYADLMKVMSGKGGTVMINGAPRDAAYVDGLMKNLGIASGGQFREGLKEALTIGQAERSKMKGMAMVPVDFVTSTFHSLRSFGEHGENWTRGALFINRLKQGYSPEMAAMEVEKFLFDFNRNSQLTDQVRRFGQPFIQHALKTAKIAPELVGASPASYNFVHNTFLKSLANAFNDPVSQASIVQLAPQFKQYQDPVAGPLIPGNSWIMGALTNEKNSRQMGSAVLLRAGIGMDILNSLDFMSKDMASKGYGIHPLLRTMAGLVSGVDPFTKIPVDIDASNPSNARRLAYAFNSAVGNEFAMPNVTRFIRQELGFVPAENIQPKSMMLLNGSFGQFGSVINLDKEFLAKTMAFAKISKDLQGQLASAIVRESNGRTSDIMLANKPLLAKGYNMLRERSGSPEVYDALMGRVETFRKAQAASGYLQGQYSAQDLAKMLTSLHSTIEAANHNYQVAKTEYFKMANEAKSQGADAQAKLLDMFNGKVDPPLKPEDTEF